MKVNYREIKIERGVPTPPDETRNLFATLEKMGMGDSFAVTEAEFEHAMDGIRNFEMNDSGKDNREYLIDGQHLRVWRIK